jgi:hypothetical protein
MLHLVVPGHVDKNGYFCLHGKDFKEREKQFEHYAEIVAWGKKNKQHFFKG